VPSPSLKEPTRFANLFCAKIHIGKTNHNWSDFIDTVLKIREEPIKLKKNCVKCGMLNIYVYPCKIISLFSPHSLFQSLVPPPVVFTILWMTCADHWIVNKMSTNYYKKLLCKRTIINFIYSWPLVSFMVLQALHIHHCQNYCHFHHQAGLSVVK
jgi:hypothetical protein